MSDDDERRDDAPGGLFDRLLELIEALDDLDESDLDRDDVRIDFDYDVRTGIGPDRGDRPGKSDARRRNRSRDRNRPSGDRNRRSRDRSRTIDVEHLDGDPGRTYHVDVDERDDEVLVKADLPGTSEEDLSVDVEDGTVRVVVDGEVITEIPVDWDDGTVTDVDFSNQVLVVTLTREGVDDPDDEAGDGGESDGA